jgi:hypothetical protein
MPDGHGHYAGLAGTGRGADTSKDVSGAAFSFGHAGCARRAIAAWRARSNARFGLWGLPGHGARRNATGRAAYPMVLPYLCRRFRSTRLPCRARGRSASRRPPDKLPMAAAGRFRCRRSLARACGAVGIPTCPRPDPKVKTVLPGASTLGARRQPKIRCGARELVDLGQRRRRTSANANRARRPGRVRARASSPDPAPAATARRRSVCWVMDHGLSNAFTAVLG